MKELVHAGLAESRQAGRQVIYSANLASMTALMAFLTENCCGGASCTPNPCCESAPESEHVHL